MSRSAHEFQVCCCHLFKAKKKKTERRIKINQERITNYFQADPANTAAYIELVSVLGDFLTGIPGETISAHFKNKLVQSLSEAEGRHPTAGKLVRPTCGKT